TGAPGWLGTRLVEVLVRGLPDVRALAASSDRRVRCLVLQGTESTQLRSIGPYVEIVEGDLTDPASLGPFFADAEGAKLFHSAGVIHPRGGIRQLYAVNVDGTRHLVDGAARAKVVEWCMSRRTRPSGRTRRRTTSSTSRRRTTRTWPMARARCSP